DPHDLERILEAERTGLAALDLERDQVRAPLHLLANDRGLWMVGPARIEQFCHLRLLREHDRDRRRSVGLLLPAYAERLQALEQDPGVERRQRRPGLPDQLMHVVLDELLGTEDHATEATALAVD